jgi:hypothetical protein
MNTNTRRLVAIVIVVAVAAIVGAGVGLLRNEGFSIPVWLVAVGLGLVGGRVVPAMSRTRGSTET